MNCFVLCSMFFLLWRSSISFHLHDILRDLQTENAFLHSKVENMTEMLMELKFFIWNSSRGSAPSPEQLQERTFCNHDTVWARSSRINIPLPVLIAVTQALLTFISK